MTTLPNGAAAVPFSSISLDDVFVQYVRELPSDCHRYLMNLLQRFGFPRTSSDLVMEVVLDTNILFKQVRRYALEGHCVLQKLAESPYVRLYAPRRLKQEIHEKIDTKFPRDKKTKELNLKDCHAKADKLLRHIRVIPRTRLGRAIAKRARDAMKERDPKDADFLAVSLQFRVHGILTEDKDFSVQNDVRTWTLREVGQVVTCAQKGVVTITCGAIGFDILGHFVASVVSAMWQAIVNITSVIVQAAPMIAGVAAAGWVAGFIWALVCDKTDAYVSKSVELAGVAESRLREGIAIIKDFFAALLKLLEPLLISAGQLGAYFVNQASNMAFQIEELQKMRPLESSIR